MLHLILEKMINITPKFAMFFIAFHFCSRQNHPAGASEASDRPVFQWANQKNEELPEFKNDPLFVIPQSRAIAPELGSPKSGSEGWRKKMGVFRYLTTLGPAITSISKSRDSEETLERYRQMKPTVHRSFPQGTSSEEFWRQHLLNRLKELKRVLQKAPSQSSTPARSLRGLSPHQSGFQAHIQHEPTLMPKVQTQAPTLRELNATQMVFTAELREEITSPRPAIGSFQGDQDVNVSSNVVLNAENGHAEVLSGWELAGPEGFLQHGFRSLNLSQDYYPSSYDEEPVSIDVDGLKRLHEYLPDKSISHPPSQTFSKVYGQVSPIPTLLMKIEDMVDDFGNITPGST